MEENFVQGWTLDIDPRDFVPTGADQLWQERLTVHDLQEEASLGQLR